MNENPITKVNRSIYNYVHGDTPYGVIKIDLYPIYIVFKEIIEKSDYLLLDSVGNVYEIFLIVVESTLITMTDIKSTDSKLPDSKDTIDTPYLPFVIEDNIDVYYQTPVTSEIHNVIMDNPSVFNMVYSRLIKEDIIRDPSTRTYCVKHYTIGENMLRAEILCYSLPIKLEEIL